jgi:hypothetical protein
MTEMQTAEMKTTKMKAELKTIVKEELKKQ